MPSLSSCYEVLGLPFGASQAEVRGAYRRIAAELQASHADPTAASRYAEAVEAYRTLTNPHPAMDLIENGDTLPPMLHRLTGHLNSLLPTGSARIVARDAIELVVTAEERATGGVAMISFETDIVCRTCGGADVAGCPRCGGRAQERELVSFWVSIPAGVADGTSLRPNVDPLKLVRPMTFVVRGSAGRR